MKKMSDKAVLADRDSMEREYREDRARRINRWVVGRTLDELADLVGYSRTVIQSSLQLVAVLDVCGAVKLGYVEGGKLQANKAKDVERILSKHAPKLLSEEYVQEYMDERQPDGGHLEPVAKLKAKYYEAAEKALEKGALKESTTAQGEKIVTAHLGRVDDWNMRCRRAMTSVKLSALTLNRATLPQMRRAETAEHVAAAHAAWMAEIRRLKTMHPDFDKLVRRYSSERNAASA